MQVTVTFRHVRASNPLRRYAEEKLGRLDKYPMKPMEAHVVLDVAKTRHRAEINLVAKGASFFSEESTEDLYSAIDLAVDKIERQLKKLRSKRKNHRASKTGEDAVIRLRVLSPDKIDEDGAPEIIRTRQIPSKPMSVDEAVMQMDLSNNEFFVFRNDSNEHLSVIYRRKDGNYGLIESD